MKKFITIIVAAAIIIGIGTFFTKAFIFDEYHEVTVGEYTVEAGPVIYGKV